MGAARDFYVETRGAVSEAEARALFAAPGEVLKRSRRSETRRVGAYVIKQTHASSWAQTLRLTLCSAYRRRAWEAAQRLHDAGVGVPAPCAYAEWRRGPFVCSVATASAYLDGYRTVEEFAFELASRRVSEGEAAAYLERLGQAIRRLVDAGARHEDLSGKNILTRDGVEFRFIDLDAVCLGGAYPRAARLKNHVQIYDSFCDLWGPEILGPFFFALLPPEIEPYGWLREVQTLQAQRRARLIAAWARIGKRAPRGG